MWNRDRADQGSILIPTLLASLLGAVLAVVAAVVLVQSASDADAQPVQKPLISYDER